MGRICAVIVERDEIRRAHKICQSPMCKMTMMEPGAIEGAYLLVIVLPRKKDHDVWMSRAVQVMLKACRKVMASRKLMSTH